ncbi:MAG: nicotinate phosphoribosyltransferase, partial [Alphaproteobacteria bacterium]
YELNMLQAYLEAGMTGTAVFEFFVRKLPRNRGFLMAAGLEQVIDFLENARFTEPELDWLAGSGRFSRQAIEQFAKFRFTGDVHAMPEGTVFYADEPALRVTAPLPQAQLVETRVINLLHFQTLIASKAARMVLAAPGKTLVDFGLRRAHGAEAGLLAARACYLAGFAGSATTPAAALFEVPIFGTMAHSFVQAHDDETAAFEAFARSRPDNVVLLLDTYDTEAAATKVVRLAPRLAEKGTAIRGVRLDSGDLAAHAREVRSILDDGGLGEVMIFASGGIDEHTLERFAEEAAPIDGFGIGTSLTTSEDAAALDCAYKLQEYAGRPRRKRSEGKATWPGRKQVYRSYASGVMSSDLLTIEGDVHDGTPLIKPVMRDGRRIAALPTAAEARKHASAELDRLPPHLRRLETSPAYEVRVADALRSLADEVDRGLV